MTTSPDAAAQIVAERRPLTPRDRRSAWAGAAVFALTLLTCALIPSSLTHFKRITAEPFYAQDPLYKQLYLRLDTILAGVFTSAFLLAPTTTSFIAWLRPRWRSAYTFVALAATCAFICFFVVHYGRWQIDGFDINIGTDLGWRQILGQRPYVDFPATTPPGFHLGIKYAFQLFGVSWDADLYFTSLFTCVTLLWMYWAMTSFPMGRPASLAVAFAVECAAMLTHCFWSYNNSTLIMAAVFFLSCLAYTRHPEQPVVQASYLISLALLSLTKPNIAGLIIIGATTLLFFATRRKLLLLLLTLGAAVGALALLALNHVSVAAMLASYWSVARRRASVGARLMYLALSPFERHSTLLWISLLSLPLLGALRHGALHLWHRRWRAVASALLFPLALLVAIYGIFTNGDFRDLECTVLLAASCVVTFGLGWNGPLLRRFTIAILCASIAGDLYYGATRTFMYLGGPHYFFEWHDNQNRITTGVLRNMRVGAPLFHIEQQIGHAIAANPGPYFLGPRIDFNYPTFNIPSPQGFPVVWAPETMFPISAEPQLIQRWQQNRFRTLIFVKDSIGGTPAVMAYTYYPPQFLDVIHRDYSRDDATYPDITIYRLRDQH